MGTLEVEEENMGANAAKLKKAIAGGDAEIRASFDAYDKDKSGHLEGKEAVNFVNDVKKILAKSDDEDIRKLAESVNAQQWLKKYADKSGDGRLQFKEFQEFVDRIGEETGHSDDEKKEKKEKKHSDDEKKEKKDKKDKKGSGSEDSDSD